MQNSPDILKKALDWVRWARTAALVLIAVLLLVVGMSAYGYLLFRQQYGKVVAMSVCPQGKGSQVVKIRELHDSQYLIFENSDSFYRFEEWKGDRLVSAITQFDDSHTASTADVKWTTDGKCECLIDGDVWAVFSGDAWGVPRVRRG